MGGAGFPTYAKLAKPFQEGGIVIVNAAECEPILSHNIQAIENDPKKLLRELEIVIMYKITMRIQKSQVMWKILPYMTSCHDGNQVNLFYFWKKIRYDNIRTGKEVDTHECVLTSFSIIRYNMTWMVMGNRPVSICWMFWQ